MLTKNFQHEFHKPQEEEKNWEGNSQGTKKCCNRREKGGSYREGRIGGRTQKTEKIVISFDLSPLTLAVHGMTSACWPGHERRPYYLL